ncbi:MAG: hypothetical protein NTU57_02330 [Candidatus Aenigmarchaeota archaeon]|nr:hypothetical protein [Candidatus Aenigmarchaeota archaeon]
MIDLENLQTDTVLPICRNSHLIGLHIKDIEKEFNITVKFYHNPRIAQETRENNPSQEKMIEFGMGIGIQGLHKDVDKIFSFAFK